MGRTRILRNLGLLRCSSPSFEDGDFLPRRHSLDGGSISPALSWSDVRPETASIVLTFEDLRGLHGKPFTLWMLFNIPPGVRSLREDLSKVPLPSDVPGAAQGLNDEGTVGYAGPAPPPGGPAHRYLFQIHSLDAVLDLPPGVKRTLFDRAVNGHVLETGALMVMFQR
ncbi:MAG TPA: YbhB/YbcL family Raf kinase inhibitor-like protein [Planctomycetota bacterium]|nr:YbhB/YbcL family Raf kinase inhibitor-like protein [Planctomycetota bacterium]